MNWLKESYELQDLADTYTALKKFTNYCEHLANELENYERSIRNWEIENAKEPDFQIGIGYFEILFRDTNLYSYRQIWLDDVISLIERYILEGYFDDSYENFKHIFFIHRRLTKFSVSWDELRREIINKKWIEVYNIHHEKEKRLLMSPIKSKIHTIITLTWVDAWIPDILNVLQERSFLDSKQDMKLLKDFIKFLTEKSLIPKQYSTINNSKIESELLNIFTLYFLSWSDNSINSAFKANIKKYVENYAWSIKEREESQWDDIYEEIPAEYRISSYLIQYIWELKQENTICYSENIDELITLLKVEDIITSAQSHLWSKMLETSEYINEVILEILYHLLTHRFFEDSKSQLLEVWALLLTVYNKYDCDGELNIPSIPDEWTGDYGNRLNIIEEYLANFVDHIDGDDIMRCSKQ